MSDKIIRFPKKKRFILNQEMTEKISQSLAHIIESTDTVGGLLLLLKHNGEVWLSIDGDLTTDDISHMGCIAIHEAYQLEAEEEF
jgi:hypothetical protein